MENSTDILLKDTRAVSIRASRALKRWENSRSSSKGMRGGGREGRDSEEPLVNICGGEGEGEGEER